MQKTKLTDKHFCFVLFLEMSPTDFIGLLETNKIIDALKFLEPKENFELYKEAKELITEKNMSNVKFDFDYDSEPFVFNKYIDGKLDRPYKICIFSAEEDFLPVTSNVYCEGMPLFFDPDGNLIQNSLN